MISLSGLNDPQRSAAEHIDGPVLILAGAGSGKTRTITYRIAHMVSNLHIPPKQILAVSFTNKAAKEMQERTIGLLGKARARGLTLATFHSLGVRVLKKEITRLGYHKNFSIYDTSDQISIVKEALKSYRAEKGAFDAKNILAKIGNLKNAGISEEEYANTPGFDPDAPYDMATEYVYRYYQDKLQFYSAIDFDDILFLTVKIFREYPEVAKEYSERYRYIMIDEYQDTNELQFQLVLALTSTHENLCVVGDDDQAIYSFRGANIQNILNFEKNFPSAKVIKLEENYRSTSPILDLANTVIKENKSRRDKTLWSKKESPVKPVLWSMGSTEHESEVIVDEIAKHMSKGGHLGDIAILYRSNTQAQIFEENLRMSQIPYTLIGGQKFYDKKEVKDLIAYLSVLVNPMDQIALRRILNIPNRGIGRATLEKYLTLSEEKEVSLFRAMEQTPDLDPKRADHINNFVRLIRSFQDKFEKDPLPQALNALIEDLKYFQFIDKHQDNPKQAERRKKDVMFFVESAERFQNFYQGKSVLKKFIEKLMLQDSSDTEDDDEEDTDVRKNQVTLMTLHSSKGLEFRKVFLVGMEEELLPHKRTISLGEDISEERRLCYVGITRAQEELIMTYCKERMIYGKKMPRHKSRFLIGDEGKTLCEEYDRTTFGHLSEDEAQEYKKSFFSNLFDSLD